MQLFISYASEDSEFVRPLAEALKVRFKVWFAEYELTIGDSLLKKINAGLASSDYGIVVLSPAFFSKKWPQAELDGLFALEGANKKIILPIWKDIDQIGVAKFSPILAGRMAAIAADGVPKVVEGIARSVGIAERAGELSQVADFTAKFRAMDLTLQVRHRADARLRERQGVAAIEEEFKRLCELIEKQLNDVSKESTHLKFSLRRPHEHVLEVWAPLRIRLTIRLELHAYNVADDARVAIIVEQLGKFDGRTDSHELQVLQQFFVAPYFGEVSEVIWTSPNSRAVVLSTEQIQGRALDFLQREIEKKMK